MTRDVQRTQVVTSGHETADLLVLDPGFSTKSAPVVRIVVQCRSVLQKGRHDEGTADEERGMILQPSDSIASSSFVTSPSS
jgi:hypothetical protein